MLKKLLLIGSGTALVAAFFIASSIAASAAVQGGIASPIAVVMPVCPAFSRSLSFGISGNDVTALQEYLNAQGYLAVNATGYFGPLTQSAVARWQANGGVVALGGSGSGIFGPLSRGYFLRSCGTGGNPDGGSGTSTTTQSALNFTGTPSSGIAPLTVQFTATAPQGSAIGNWVDFGDGTNGTLGFAPVCSSCNALATVSHTYTATGTYTAALMNGTCTCPANTFGPCNCPAMIILATTTVTVTTPGSSNSSSTASGIQQLDAPGSVALATGGIAEIRNENFYFTLASVTASTATIDITPVGCWNSFPSDPPAMVRCMLEPVPTPPQTLSVGQEYGSVDRSITLTNITNGTATFSVQ